jgi:hypothetical protein
MAADATTAAEFVPASRSLAKLRGAAADCHGCPLWKNDSRGSRREATRVCGW